MPQENLIHDQDVEAMLELASILDKLQAEEAEEWDLFETIQLQFADL